MAKFALTLASLGFRKKFLHGWNAATNTVYQHWNYSSPWHLSKTRTALSKPISLSNTKTFGRCLANRKPAVYHLTSHKTVLLISWLGKLCPKSHLLAIVPRAESHGNIHQGSSGARIYCYLECICSVSERGWMENGFLDNFRTYQCQVMHYGLSSVPSVFQCLINNVLWELDNILVYPTVVWNSCAAGTSGPDPIAT